jgi:hypothetical protein
MVAIALFVALQWNNYIEFRTHTNDTLASVQASIRTLEATQSPKKVLNEIAPLASKEFAGNLPALRRVSEQPPGNVGASPGALREVALKLRSVDQNVPDYWSTVFQFISFASASISSNVPPPGPPQAVIAGNHGFGTKAEFHDQIVQLNGGDFGGDVVFTRCRIIFSKNRVRLSGVKFIDCVFEMPVTDSPSPMLAQIAGELLASDFKSVVLQAL